VIRELFLRLLAKQGFQLRAGRRVEIVSLQGNCHWQLVGFFPSRRVRRPALGLCPAAAENIIPAGTILVARYGGEIADGAAWRGRFLAATTTAAVR